jgi:uncharacterized membrane protein
MIDRVKIKDEARFLLKERYWFSVGAFFVIALITNILYLCYILVPGFGACFLVFIPALIVGGAYISRMIYLRDEAKISDILRVGFTGKNFGGMLWLFLFSTLWSLLFIIPGIIKSYSYFLTPYILTIFGDVKAREALKISKTIMYGYKAKVFVMQLSFIGWQALSLITLGILGIFYTNPYYQITSAGFAVSIIKEAKKEGKIDDNGHLTKEKHI